LIRYFDTNLHFCRPLLYLRIWLQKGCGGGSG
jgi:hypothetical protein